MSSPTKTFSVRPARREDLPAIAGIYNWAVNQTFATIDSEALSQEEVQSWYTDHIKDHPLCVAEDGNGVIGWARLMPWKQRGFDIAEDLVYVDPVHHGRGVGRQLLQSIIESASELGYRSIVASVATDNRSGLQLHQNAGFEVVGTLKNAAYKFGRWMDITLVQKALTAND